MGKKLTYEEVKNIIQSYNYDLLDDKYINNKTLLTIICPDKHIFYLSFNTFQTGVRCKECYRERHIKKMKNEKEGLVKKIAELASLEKYYVDLSEYTSNKQQLDFTCPSGHNFKMKWNTFNSGRRCSKCKGLKNGNSKRKPLSNIKDFLASKKYEMLDESEYINNKIPFRVQCSNGHTFTKNWLQFYKKGEKCIECNPHFHKWDIDKVKNVAAERGFLITSKKYVNNSTKLNIICPEGHIFQQSWSGFYSCGYGCTKCHKSKGEMKVELNLNQHSLKYKTEKRFENCRNKLALPFDFYLKNHKNIILLIEYDGIQHFKPISFGGKNEYRSKKSHIQTMINDKIKNTYCFENKIPLVRIPYWEFSNIDYIISHVLGYYGFIHKNDVDKDLVNKFLVNHPDWSYEKYIAQQVA